MIVDKACVANHQILALLVTCGPKHPVVVHSQSVFFRSCKEKDQNGREWALVHGWPKSSHGLFTP